MWEQQQTNNSKNQFDLHLKHLKLEIWLQIRKFESWKFGFLCLSNLVRCNKLNALTTELVDLGLTDETWIDLGLTVWNYIHT